MSKKISKIIANISKKNLEKKSQRPALAKIEN